MQSFSQICYIFSFIEILQENSRLGMIRDKIQNYFMNGAATISFPTISHLFSAKSHIQISEQRRQRHHKARNLHFADITLNKNQTAPFSLCPLIAASLFVVLWWKNGDDLWPKLAECLPISGCYKWLYEVQILRQQLVRLFSSIKHTYPGLLYELNLS